MAISLGGSPPFSLKALGVTLAKEARKPVPASAPPSAHQAKHITKKWSEHIGGDKELLKIDEAKGDPKKARKLVENWLKTESGFATYYIKRAHWRTGETEQIDLEDYQIHLMDLKAKYALFKKARRIGLSLGIGARGLVRAHLNDALDSYYISKNHDEAKEKIKYAKEMYYTMPDGIKKDLANRGVMTRMEFLGPDGISVSRLMSYPQTEPRGIEGDIYLDEFACYLNQEAIYTAATNAISRKGGLWIVTTPRNKGDLFYKIDKGETAKKKFENHRYTIPWWQSRIMVDPLKFDRAQAEAPVMLTRTRVYEFGSQNLIDVYESNVSESDFMVEYECEYNDDANAFYPDELLDKSLYSIIDEEIARELTGEKVSTPEMDRRLKELGIQPMFFKSINEVEHALRNGLIGARLIAAVDPGFTDGCSIIIIEEIPEKLAVVRYNVKLVKVSYHKREQMILEMGKRLPIAKIAIDCKDPQGNALASNLRNSPHFGHHKIDEIRGSAMDNNEMAIDLRRRMELGLLAIPDYEPLKKDIKKVKRDFNKNGEPTISVVRDKDGHGDRYYSLIYAVHCLAPIGGSAANMSIPDTTAEGIPQRTFQHSSEQVLSDYQKILAGEKAIKNPTIADFADIRLDSVFDTSRLPRP